MGAERYKEKCRKSMCTRELNDIFMKTTIFGIQFAWLFSEAFIVGTFIVGGYVRLTMTEQLDVVRIEKVLPQRNLFSFYYQYCRKKLHIGDLMRFSKETKLV